LSQSLLFYNFIIKKENFAYYALYDALDETKQTKSLAIIDDGFELVTQMLSYPVVVKSGVRNKIEFESGTNNERIAQDSMSEAQTNVSECIAIPSRPTG